MAKRFKHKLLFSVMAVLLVVAVAFAIGGKTMMSASAATNSNSTAYRYDHYKEDTDTFKRDRVYQVYVNEYDSIYYDVPLKALSSGVNIRYNTTITVTKEKDVTSSYSATVTVGARLSSEYGASAEADIEVVTGKIYEKFATEFSATYSNTLTRTVSEKEVETRSISVTDSSMYGFYTINLKAYKAKKYSIRIYWTEYTCSRANTKSDWSDWTKVDSGSYFTYYYIPTTSSTYVSYDKFDSASAYASYMDNYHAIY